MLVYRIGGDLLLFFFKKIAYLLQTKVRKGGCEMSNVPLQTDNHLKGQLPNSFIKHLAKQYSGKYLLRNEIAINQVVFEKLLSLHLFKCTPSIRKSSFGSPQ